MSNIFPIDFEEKLTMAQDDYILFSDSEDWNKIKKAQYKNLKWEPWTPWTPWKDWEDGAAATITVWSTTTGTPWSSASVTNSWTSSAAVLDFTIPQGAKWETWAWATVAVGTTTTLPAGSSATVTNSWTSTNAVLNFGIPKGDSWSWSWDVSWPASSTDWDVAIFDWATWKLIKDGSVALSTLSSAASLASTAIQPWDNVSDLVNDAGYLTSAPVTSVNTQTGAVVLDADDISDSTTTNKWTNATEKTTWNWKQDALVSGTNIKTINSNSILGSWDLVVSGLPAGWTTWQILIMTANWPARADPTDANIVMSDTNAPIIIRKLWWGTEWDYSAVQTYNENEAYLTIEEWVTPPTPRTPWANTLAYWKLDGDLTDEMGSYDWTVTSNATVTFESLPWDANVKCAKVNSNWFSYWISLPNTLCNEILSAQTSFTFSAFVKTTNSSTEMLYLSSYPAEVYFGVRVQGGQNTWDFFFETLWQSWNFYTAWISANTWYNVVFTYDHTTQTKWFYINGVSAGTYTIWTNYTTSSTPISAMLARINSNTLLSNMVLEKGVAWTQQDAENYFNTFKSLYSLS